MKTVAKTLLFDKDDRILVLYRGRTHPRYAHHPDFPGGEVEQGESFAEAISREIQEETGLMIEAELIREAHIKEIDDELTHVICKTFINTSQPTIDLSWEHEGFEWLTLDELKTMDRPNGADDYYLGVLEYLSQ